jgi:hypothetical protein
LYQYTFVIHTKLDKLAFLLQKHNTMKRFLFLSALTISSLFLWAFTHQKELVKTQGAKLIDNGNEFIVKAIILDHNALNRLTTPRLPAKATYQEIKELGFNTVKILINYKDFEIDKRSSTYKAQSWLWLNEHIKLAKDHNLKIILTMYVAPGGHQTLNNNKEIWLNNGFQNRFRKLWANISLHYKNEPSIIGYDLLDSPSPKYSIGQWKQLAKNIITSLRQTGDHHIIFLQNCVFKDNSEAKQNKEEFNFIYLPDFKNIVYDFHYYGEKSFSWQHIKNTGYFNDNETYPDANKYTFPDDLEVFDIKDDNTRIGIGTTEFAFVEGKKYLIKDSSIKSILPVIYSDNLLPGFAFYNYIIIKEYSPTGQHTRDVIVADPNKVEGWEIDTKDPQAKFSLIADYGTLLISVIRIDRVETPTRVYNKNLRFVPKLGFYYSIGAHTLTNSVNFKGESYLRFEYERSASGKLAGSRTLEGTELQLQYYIDWANNKNVPLLIGEYGTSDYSFKRDRGGDRYLNDLKSLIDKYHMNACFNSFDSEYFGIYEIDSKGKQKAKKAQLKVWQ